MTIDRRRFSLLFLMITYRTLVHFRTIKLNDRLIIHESMMIKFKGLFLLMLSFGTIVLILYCRCFILQQHWCRFLLLEYFRFWIYLSQLTIICHLIQLLSFLWKGFLLAMVLRLLLITYYNKSTLMGWVISNRIFLVRFKEASFLIGCLLFFSICRANILWVERFILRVN